MNDQQCPQCEGWFDEYEHDFRHLRERKVEALERIAAALEGGLGAGRDLGAMEVAVPGDPVA